MEEDFDKLTDFTGRSISQTKFLFELCDSNFKKLVELENKMKKKFIWSCPADKDEVERIMNL